MKNKIVWDSVVRNVKQNVLTPFINLIHLEAIIVTRSIIMHITLLDTVCTMYVCVLLLLLLLME